MAIHSNFSARQLAAAAATVTALATGMVVGGTAASAAEPPHANASVANNALTIKGTNGNDTIQVSLAPGDPTTVVVDLGYGVQDHFAVNAFTSITAFLGAGDDHFTEQPSGGVLAADVLTAFGGAGNDSIVGGDANDVLFGGTGDDNLQGGGGTDQIFGGRGNDTMNGNKGNDTEFGGSGRDTAVWNPGEGSDVIDGGSDTDTLVFNGAAGNEVMSLSPNGAHAIFSRDVANIRMDLVGVEQVNVAALGGADSLTLGDLTGTDVRLANFDLGGKDSALDTVTVNGTSGSDNVAVTAERSGAVDLVGLHTTAHIVGAEPTDHLVVNGRGGQDYVNVSQRAASLIGVTVNF